MVHWQIDQPRQFADIDFKARMQHFYITLDFPPERCAARIAFVKNRAQTTVLINS